MPEQKRKQNWDQGVMTQIKKGERQGINLRPYAELGYDCNIIKQIRRARAFGTDIDLFAREGYDGEQLREIRVALKQGVALTAYLSKGFCGAQLRQIRKGLRHFVDVKLYTDPKYNWLQMQEIRLGLQNRIDASVYANPFYSYSQMKEIRLGLEEGIDVSSYANLLYSCTDMREKRKKLTEKFYAGEPELKDIILTDASTGIKMRLTGNRLKAYIIFPKEQRKINLTVDYAVEILRRNGIIYGIDRDAIEHALQEKRYEEDVLAAVGVSPEVGKDGYYEFYFNSEPSRKPIELEDGRVDYQNVNIFDEVEKGQVIARYIQPATGAKGMCVRGINLPGTKGRDLPVLRGKGFRLEEDGVTYTAAISGMIEYKKGQIRIYEALIIREDVTSSYGNIHFHGCVHIYGSVGANVEIYAEGSISVEGNVEAAVIDTRGDVLIKNGMAGAGRGSVRAEGTIAGNFFEACNLHAGGNIEAGYLMNSESYAANKVVIIGKRGSIIGGRTRGVFGIEVNNIGNRSQILTDVETGAGQEVLDEVQRCQSLYEQVQSQLLDISNRIKRFDEKMKKTIAYKKILSEQLKLKEQAVQIREERRKAQEILMADSEINVLSRAYAGTRITINQATRMLTDDCKMTTFCLENSDIISK